MPEEWVQVHFFVDASQVDAYELALESVGALAVTQQNAAAGELAREIFEPPLGETPVWRETRVTGLFAAPAELDVAMEHMRQILHIDTKSWCFSTQTLANKAWQNTWQAYAQPLKFGTSLWVVPSCYQATLPKEARAIVLDPGVAFGTGTHETTALCLEWISQQSFQDSCVLDFGCGSGILALAMAVMGAVKVYAVDIDPQACVAAHDNALNNGLAEVVAVSAVERLPGSLRVDGVVANILLQPLMTLQRQFVDILKPRGFLVVSGILNQQVDELKASYASDWLVCDQATKSDWSLLVLQKKV